MTIYHLLHDRRFSPYYGAMAVLFFILGAYLEAGAGLRRESRISLEKENEMLTAYKDAKPQAGHGDFLGRLFQKGSPEAYAALLEEAGLTVKEIGESEGGETKLRKFNKIELQGTGTFSQIIRGFDIIQSEERWNAADLKELTRRGPELAFTMEITTFQSRGTYEEKKYRTHRSHGDRKEQSR